MADGTTIKVEDYAKAIDTYVRIKPTDIKTMLNRATETTLDKHTLPLTKTKGKYVQFHSVLSHLVQGFNAEWEELGKATFAHKTLKNYHIKVNFPIIPAEIEGTALAEMYQEDKPATLMNITKWITDHMGDQIQDDLEYLSIKGDYDAAALGTFGKSMNGIEKTLEGIAANTAHPSFTIVLNTITDNNILDEVNSYEDQLPEFIGNKIKKIFMSKKNFKRYVRKYAAEYGTMTDYKTTNKLRTEENREIIAIPGLDDNVIFSSLEGNFRKLIDVHNKPEITSVQLQDYKVKVFMEAWLGYDWMFNEMLYLSDNGGVKVRGLNNSTLMTLYYPHES